MGVPQEFILAPLLYSIYVSDLANNLSAKPLLFANDHCLLLKAKSGNGLKEAI